MEIITEADLLHLNDTSIHPLRLYTNKSEVGTIIKTLSWTVSTLGVLGTILNMFVIIQICYQGLTKVHFSKLYFVSLATADLIMAIGSASFSFIFTDIIEINEHHRGFIFLCGIAGISFTSSLLHSVVITTDRFIGTKFPLFYRQIRRKQVAMVISAIWLTSCSLMITVIWDKRIAMWCGVVGVPIASCAMIAIYIFIVCYVLKRHRLRSDKNKMAAITPDDVRKSINTICLSVSITTVYIMCTLPFAITFMFYLARKLEPRARLTLSLHTLLTLHTVADPTLYTLFAIIVRKWKELKSFGKLAEENIRLKP